MTMLAFSLLATAFDLRDYKIPNALCAGMMLTGVCMTAYHLGFSALRFSFAGILIPFTLLYLVFYCGMIGAGDIKLFSGIGAFAGTKIVLIMALAFLFNGILAAGKLCMKGNFMERIGRFYVYARACEEKGRLLTDYPSDEDSRIHFSIGILAAVVVFYLVAR